MERTATPLTSEQLEQFIETLKPIVAALSEHQIKDLSRQVNRTRREIYPDSQDTKIVSRDDMTTSDIEEEQILEAYRPGWDKFKLAREIINDTGARVAMVARLKTEQIDWEKARVSLYLNKIKGRPEGKPLKPIPLSLNTFLHLKEFVKKNQAKIEKHSGHVFFSEPLLSIRNQKIRYEHVVPQTISRYYTRAKKRAGMLKKYGEARPAFNPRTGRTITRPLYKYRMHDARTKLIRKAIWKHNLPPALVSEMLGIKIDTIMHYAGEAPQELRDLAFTKVQNT